VGGESAFSELGVDSLTGIEFIDAINRKLGIKLQTSAIYDHPSVSAMTRFVIPQIFPSSTQTSEASGPAMLCVIDTPSPNGDSQAIDAVEPMKSPDAPPTAVAVAAEDDIDGSLADLLAELNKWKS
jgi:hypothetical protein